MRWIIRGTLFLFFIATGVVTGFCIPDTNDIPNMPQDVAEEFVNVRFAYMIYFDKGDESYCFAPEDMVLTRAIYRDYSNEWQLSYAIKKPGFGKAAMDVTVHSHGDSDIESNSYLDEIVRKLRGTSECRQP